MIVPSELQLSSLGHCYILLPETLVSKEPSLKAGAIISIRSVQNDTELFVMWNGQLSSGEHSNLDLNFGRANKFQDELIIISSANDLQVSECSMCRVKLLETSDYSIISQHVDAHLLDTCRLIYKGLTIPLVLSQNVKVPIQVLSMQPDSEYCILSKWTEMQFEHSLENLPEIDNLDHGQITEPIPIVSHSLGIDYDLKFSLGSMLICGERGSGKTYRLKKIINEYKKYHSDIFNCKQLRGKRPESVTKKLSELLNDALEAQPSILGLDDIDAIVSNDPKHDDERGFDSIYRKRLVSAFCHMLKLLERSEHPKGRRVMIIATCRSITYLDKNVAMPKGRQYFTMIVEIGYPTIEERVKVIKKLISEHKQIRSCLDDDQIKEVALRCSSYMPLDLKRLVERSIISACSRSHLDFDAEPLSIQLDDLMSSLDTYVPSNLRGIALKPKSDKSFDNVGGMKEVKETLNKMISLRLKYPKLFKNCPIKLQTSVLLYGPPGCGKTLIAEALTNQDCVNSICVRGPELLSKYIGASEAAVRDLFRRAEIAKPCIIFFDEFESLVARRGADSTGVTDRIVNQFLTLMDGVEKMSSDVFIVAASSRPDMIDPAILRPGRLDKHIYCPVPDHEDRFHILKVLSKNIFLEQSNEAHLENWSHKLENFTGADIQSFLYSAQLKALHDTVGDIHIADDLRLPLENGQLKSEIEIRVKQIHLERSFDEMRMDVLVRNANLTARYPPDIRKINQQVATRATLN